MNPLTDTEKAYFDTIKNVTRSARPEDLRLHRMELDGQEVAVIVQTVIRSGTAELVGYQPLAIICNDGMVDGLRAMDGREPILVPPDEVEGAAS